MKLNAAEVAALARKIQRETRDALDIAQETVRGQFRAVAEEDFEIYNNLSLALKKTVREVDVEEIQDSHFRLSNYIAPIVKSTDQLRDEITLLMGSCKNTDEIQHKLIPCK